MIDIHDYSDIIDTPYKKSDRHTQMALIDRAAQFAPFAALTGYETQIKEASRSTMSRIELSEDEKIIINDKLNYLNIHKEIEAEFLYYEPDNKKEGGSYHNIKGSIHSIDIVNNILILNDKTKIMLTRLVDVISNELDILSY